MLSQCLQKFPTNISKLRILCLRKSLLVDSYTIAELFNTLTADYRFHLPGGKRSENKYMCMQVCLGIPRNAGEKVNTAKYSNILENSEDLFIESYILKHMLKKKTPHISCSCPWLTLKEGRLAFSSQKEHV